MGPSLFVFKCKDLPDLTVASLCAVKAFYSRIAYTRGYLSFWNWVTSCVPINAKGY